jgi:hypothetical protein
LAGYGKHHYVPRFLLAQWHSAPDDRLSKFYWFRERLHHERRSAVLCARHRNLYRMQSASEPQVLESVFFQRLDNDGGKVHQRLLHRDLPKLSDAECIAWSNFLVALMHRHPLKVSELRKRGREALRWPDDQRVDIEGFADVTVNEFIATWLPHLPDDLGVRVLRDVAGSALINNALLSATWMVLELGGPDAFDLVLGDRPVIYRGTMETSYLLALPIAPRTVFMAFNMEKTGEAIRSSSSFNAARRLNAESIRSAAEYVFCRDSSSAWLVQKYLRSPARPPPRSVAVPILRSRWS